MKKFLLVLGIAAALTAQASAYVEGDIPIEFELGLGTSWGEAESMASDWGYEFEVGVKVGKFFTDTVGVMGGLSIDYFSTPYNVQAGTEEFTIDVSAICLTIPVGVYISPSGGLIFGGGLSLSTPIINMSSATLKYNDGMGNILSEDANGNDVIKFTSFVNVFIDAGYDFGESGGEGVKLLLRYSKSLSDINSDEGSVSKDFVHLMIGYSYITY
jgi:hypothetical protein